MLKDILKNEWRLLTFRSFTFHPDQFNHYLAFGLICTWFCGIGRYWDNPRADLWQYLGLGSVAYVFILAAILWAIIKPLKPRHWRYKNVLLFVTLTSPPALLYAIPVEHFMSMEHAQLANVIFLAVVALWRVALLIRYLLKSAKLSGLAILVASLLPLTLIVAALTVLNLEHVVFRIMAGIRPEEKSANDAAYFILIGITFLSVNLFPFLLALYGWLVYKRRAL